MAERSTRLKSADLLKGTMIIAIVFIHILSGNPDSKSIISDSNGTSVNVISLGIQTFYLGLMGFFILSGYFCRPERGFADNMRGRLKQLVAALTLCTVTLPLISYAWMAVLGKAPGPEDILTACQWGFGMNGVFEPLNASPPHPICGGSVGYYFLWAMIWGFAIFYAAAGRIYSSWRKCVASVAVLLVITAILQEFFPVKLPMYCQLGPPAAMFMILGMMLSKLGAIESAESFDIRSWKIWAVLAGSAVSAAALAIIFPPGLEWQYGGAPVPILFTEAAIVFIFLMHLSALVSKIPGISNIFIFAGKHTLGTLLLHGSVATMIFAPFFDFDGISWFPKDADFASRLSVAAITVIICMCTCVIVNSFLARKTGSRNITG